MLKQVTILILVLLIFFLLTNIIVEDFASENLNNFYKDIVPVLYKHDPNSVTFKDVPRCGCGYLTIKNTDIAVRDDSKYYDLSNEELKPLLREYIIENGNMGWRNIVL